MSNGRHSFIAFYPSDWIGGTSRLPRIVQSVYFDVCLYNWDKGEPVSRGQLDMMLMDLDPGQGEKIIAVLVANGKLQRGDNGEVWSVRAMAEAEKAYVLWEKKSDGGKKAAEAKKIKKAAVHKQSMQQSPTEPEPEPEPTVIGKTSSSLLPASGNEAEPEKPEAEKPDDGEKPKRISAGQCAEVFAAWNAVAKPLGLKGADKMTDKRQAAIRARIEENGADAVERALAALPECEFVLSEAKKGANWTSIDWFLRPNTITKINEGQYRTANGKGSSAWAEMDQ